MKKQDEHTGHKHVPGDLDQPALGNADGASPMGMTGATGGPDPDQKSTHVAPKTVESNLPDGSPKYADAGKVEKKAAAKAGKYEVVNRISTKVDGKAKSYEAGEFVELEAAEAESLGESIKPAR